MSFHLLPPAFPSSQPLPSGTPEDIMSSLHWALQGHSGDGAMDWTGFPEGTGNTNHRGERDRDIKGSCVCELEKTPLRESSQPQKATHCRIPFM